MSLKTSTILAILSLTLILLLASAEDIQPGYNNPENQVSVGQRIALGFFASTTFMLTILVLYLRSELARQTIRRLMGGLTSPLLGPGGGGGGGHGRGEETISPIGVELSDRV
mmetsp:Transcript_15346/g.33379  ORF Transcript_15346/g.33379 Transcript_15346/m.33379 type:complete len:112 (+) Transcript_15346:72-407(+)